MPSSASVAAAPFRNVCWLPEFRSHDSIPGAEPVHHEVSQRIYRACRPASEESEAMGLQPAEYGRTPRLAISADRIFDGYRWHDDSVILIEGGVIQRIAPRDRSPGDWSTEVMPPGTVLAPGFIDLQVNGGGGILLNDQPTPGAMRTIARAHRRYGTTSCLPTLITDTRAKATAAIAAAKLLDGSDGILGLHLEGPFISPSRPGIHRSDRILTATREDLDWLEEL